MAKTKFNKKQKTNYYWVMRNAVNKLQRAIYVQAREGKVEKSLISKFEQVVKEFNKLTPPKK